MMTMAPSTDREKLIAEMAHLQGYADGVKAITDFLRARQVRTLEMITRSEIDKQEKMQ